MWSTERILDLKPSPVVRLLVIVLVVLLTQVQASAGPVAPPGPFNLPDAASEPEDVDPVPFYSLDFELGDRTLAASADGPALCEDDACPDLHVLGRHSLTGAAVFDGIDDHLAVPQTVSVALDESFTVVAWIKGSDFEKAEQVILGDTTGNLRLSVRDKRLFMTLDGVHVNSAAPRLLDHKWHHVVWRYDSETGEQALFLDGYLKNTGESTGEIPDHARLQVGCAGRDGYYQGALDDISIYDGVLSESEIFHLANPSLEGDGIDAHLIDLRVQLAWFADPDDDNRPTSRIPSQAYCERVFGFVADALYDMTEGGMILRNVRITPSWDLRDIIWVDHKGSPEVDINGYGSRHALVDMPGWVGEHDLMNEETGARKAAYVMAHQLGHYLLGLGDEGPPLHRSEFLDNDEETWVARPEDPGALLFQTLMSDPIYPAGTYEEVCVERYPWWEFWHWGQCARTAWQRDNPASPRLAQLSTDMNFGVFSTAQGRTYGTNAWATLIRPPSEDPYFEWSPKRLHWPHLTTHAPDLNSRPPVQMTDEAREYLNITYHVEPLKRAAAESQTAAGRAAMPNGIVRLYALDVSGAMTAEHLQQAKAALKQRVDQMPEGDTLGLITFSSGVTVTQPFMDLNIDNREPLKATIDGIALGHAGVATGDALDHAVAMLTAADVPTDVYKSLHVIGTGETTTGLTLPTAGRSVEGADVDLYAFHYETSPDAGHALRELAEANRGVYTKVTDQTTLASALKAAEAATTSR